MSAGAKLRAEAVAASARQPVLADDINAEALALDGHQVWIANPLDAFAPNDQRRYLDWIAGRPAGDVLLKRFSAALVTRETPVARRLAAKVDWRVAAKDDRAVLYVKKGA
jgi:hypothetical protein